MSFETLLVGTLFANILMTVLFLTFMDLKQGWFGRLIFGVIPYGVLTVSLVVLALLTLTPDTLESWRGEWHLDKTASTGYDPASSVQDVLDDHGVKPLTELEHYGAYLERP